MAATIPTPSPVNEAFIACVCPVSLIVDPWGKCARVSAMSFCTADETDPRSAPSTFACTSTVRAML